MEMLMAKQKPTDFETEKRSEKLTGWLMLKDSATEKLTVIQMD